jgi:hypothetical protein
MCNGVLIVQRGVISNSFGNVTITAVNDEPVKNCFLSWSYSLVLTLKMGMNLPKMFLLNPKTVLLEVQTRWSVLYQGLPIGLNIK